MTQTHLIFVAFLVFAASASALRHADHALMQFRTFKLKYGKTYENHIEGKKRFKIFQDNLRSIDRHNNLYEQGFASYRQGVNQFTDQEDVDLTSILSKRPYINATKHKGIGLTIPESVDWRTEGHVTEVKNQGNCGSCWAFALTGSTEAAYFRTYGNLVSLSEQQLVDCATALNSACRGGRLDETFPYIQNWGLQSEYSYPYVGMEEDCKYSANEVVAIVSDYKVIHPNDEDALLDAVATIGPVTVAIDSTHLFQYESGIFEDNKCTDELNHGIVIVGFGIENNTKYWICKNSWGKLWGEEGFFKIRRGTNECGIAKDAVYPTCD